MVTTDDSGRETAAGPTRATRGARPGGRGAPLVVGLVIAACGATSRPELEPPPGVTVAAVPPAAPAELSRAEEEDFPPHAPGRYFESRTFHEDELAGHHEHAVVELLGIPLFVLRDEDVFKTTEDRARGAERALREALHAGDRFFVVGDEEGTPAIYSVSHHGGFPRLVLRVTDGDAVAYERRSGREVDARVVAAWWLAVLKDSFGVVLLNEPPDGTVAAPGGDALALLRERLWGGAADGEVSPERVRAALESLPAATQERLRALAFTVPRAFVAEEGGSALGKSQLVPTAGRAESGPAHGAEAH